MIDSHKYSLTLCTLKVVLTAKKSDGFWKKRIHGLCNEFRVECGDLEVIFSIMLHFRISLRLCSDRTKVGTLACEILRVALGKTSPLHRGKQRSVAKACSLLFIVACFAGCYQTTLFH